MYTSETLDDDRTAAEMARLQRRVFTTAALTVVVFANDAPRHLLRLKQTHRHSGITLNHSLTTNTDRHTGITLTHTQFIYFARAAVAVDSSHMTASSSASWSRFGPHSNFVNRRCADCLHMVHGLSPATITGKVSYINVSVAALWPSSGLEHSNSGKKSFDSILAIESIFFDSIRQFDKLAACTLIFKQ